MQLITAVLFIYLRLFMFDYGALFVCVTDRTCLRIVIPLYCFNIFRSLFGFLFYLHHKVDIRK